MTDDFERFWRAYPRRVGKLAAAKEWAKLQPPIEAVMAALARQIPTWTDPQYIPHPRTWIHQGRWLDEQPDTVFQRPAKVAGIAAWLDQKRGA